MATQLDELFFEITVRRGPGADKELQRFTGQMQRAGQAAKKAGKNVTGFGGAAKGGVGAVAGLNGGLKRMIVLMGGLLIVRKVVGAMFSFQTRMAEVATIAVGGAEQVEVLQKSILKLAKAVPQTADELGAGAYQILSAQITDTSDIMLVLGASARAAVAGLTDTETAVNAITTVLNAFQLEASEASRVADVLFKTVELGKLKFVDIAANIGKAATSAALAGISIEELTAGFAALTQRGVNVAEAATSLNRLFLTLVNQTDDQRKAFSDLGIEFNTATIAAKGLAGLLDEVNKLSKGEIDVLAELFPNIRAARAAFVLAGTGLDQYNEFLAKTVDSTGAANRAFEIMNATATNQAKILQATIISTFQEIGLSALPAVAKAFGFIADKITAFVTELKVVAAETTLVQQQFKIFTEKVDADFARLLSSTLSKFANFTDAIATFVERLPGGEILGKVFRSTADLTSRAAAAAARLTAEQQQQVAAAQAHFGFLQAAVEETRKEILGEEEFTSTRAARIKQNEQLRQQQETLRRLTQDEREQQSQLLEDLAGRVSDVTRTAAQQTQDEIAKLKQALIDVGGTISPEIVAQFELIEEAADKAFATERAEQLGSEFAKALKQKLGDISLFGTGDIAAQQKEVLERAIDDANRELAFARFAQDMEAQRVILSVIAAIQEQLEDNAEELANTFRDELQRGLKEIDFSLVGVEEIDKADTLAKQVTLFEDIITRAQQLLAVTKSGTNEEKELRDVIIEINNLLIRARQEQARIGAEAAKDAKARLKDLQSTIRLIRQAVDGVLKLAEAFGGVSEETRKLVSNLSDIAEGGVTLAEGIASKNPAAIIGGGLQLAGGIVGLFGGDDEAKKTMEDNTVALLKLKQSLDEQVRVQSEFSAVQLRQARLGAITPSLRGAFGFTPRDVDDDELAALIRRFPEMAAVAESLGIELDGSKESFLALRDAIDELDIADFTATFSGALEQLRAEFELFGTGPQEALEKLAEQFIQFSGAGARLGQVDLSTSEGREQFRLELQRLFLAASQGQLRGLNIPFPEFRDAILDLNKSLSQLESDQPTGEDQVVRLATNITVAQGSVLLSLATTRNVLLEQIRGILSAATGISAPSAATVTTGGGTITNNSSPVTFGPNVFNIAAGPVRDQAEDIVLEAQRIMGENLSDRQRTLGIK